MPQELMEVVTKVKVNKQDWCLERARSTRILIIQMIKRLIGQQEVVLEPMEAF